MSMPLGAAGPLPLPLARFIGGSTGRWSSVPRSPVKIQTYLLLAVLIFGVLKTHRAVRQSQGPQERFFAIRASVFTWLVGFILLAAFLFLPNKQRVLLLVPAFVTVVTIVKFWQKYALILFSTFAAKTKHASR